jgi:hypothetical protein
MRNQECHHHGEPDPQLVFEHLITQLQAAVSQSINGVTLRGSLPVPIGSGSGGTIKPQGSGSRGRIMAIEVRETTTTNPVVVRVWDGEIANGQLLITLPLAAGAGTQRTYPGTSYINGLTVQVTGADGVSAPTGAIEGLLCIGAAAEGS